VTAPQAEYALLTELANGFFDQNQDQRPEATATAVRPGLDRYWSFNRCRAAGTYLRKLRKLLGASGGVGRCKMLMKRFSWKRVVLNGSPTLKSFRM
jgi:hypothetical protein